MTTTNELHAAIYTTQTLLKQAADVIEHNAKSLAESHTKNGIIEDREVQAAVESDIDLVAHLRAAALPWDQRHKHAEQPAPVQQEPIGKAHLCDRCSTPFDGEDECPECGHGSATKKQVYTSPQPAQRTDDTKRLDALAENSWDLRCFEMPSGADDADIGWQVIEHHMSNPKERRVSTVFRDDPRQAIDEAIEAAAKTKDTP